MMKLRLVVSGLVAAALFVPGKAAAYSRALSEEVAEAIAPVAQPSDAPTAAAPAAAATPAPAAGATAAAPAATAEAKKDAPADDEEGGDDKGLGIGIGADLDHSMSTYTFVAPEHYTNYVGGSLGLSARWSPKIAEGVKLGLSARWGVSLEYTPPNDDVNGRRFSHSNLSLGVGLPGVLKIPVVDIKVNPSIGLSVPLTAESWSAGLILGTSAAVSFSRSFTKYVTVSLAVNGSAPIQSKPANTGLPSAQSSTEDGPKTHLCREGEEASCNFLGWNTAFAVGGSVALSVRPIDNLSFGLNFGLGHTWKYAATDVRDEYTCDTLDSNGNPACHVGAGQSDRMTTNISVAYSFTPNLGASLYLQNSQQPLTKQGTANGQWGLRFPFADFTSPYGGSTVLGLAISGNFNF